MYFKKQSTMAFTDIKHLAALFTTKRYKENLEALTTDFFSGIGQMRSHCRSGNDLSDKFRDDYINLFAESYLAFTALDEVLQIITDNAKEFIKNILIEIATKHNCYS